MRALLRWLQALEELLLPPTNLCGLCREYPSEPVGACKGCLQALAISWEKRMVQGYPYFSLFPYQGFGRQLIRNLKFQGRYELASTLGMFLSLAVREETDLFRIDVLVPVPLAPSRLRQRGFNQAELLADKISESWKRPVCKHIIRTRETRPQSGLSSPEREKNLRGAFAVLPGFELNGKRCLIVDDVITTGQTFLALAKLIEQYGGHAYGLFVARTEMVRSDDNAEKL